MLEDEEEEEYVEQDKDLYYEIEKSYEEMDDTDNWMERYEQLGMNVIARSVDLNRAERYVTDSLLKAEQCDELFKLTEVSTYTGRSWVHSSLCYLKIFLQSTVL